MLYNVDGKSLVPDIENVNTGFVFTSDNEVVNHFTCDIIVL